MRASGRVRGWLAVDRMGDAEADPLPAVRLARRATGRPQIDRALAALTAGTETAALAERTAQRENAPLHRFVLLLRQLSAEFDAFGESAQGTALFAQLEAITLTY